MGNIKKKTFIIIRLCVLDSEGIVFGMFLLVSLCVIDSEGIVFGLFLLVIIILHPNLVRSRSLEPLGVGRSYFYTR